MIHAAFQYFREIDRQLQKVLGNETAPLVLAGVECNLPLYRNATGYAHVLDEGIYGNPEGRPAEELHAAAWEIVKPHFMKGSLNYGSSTGNYIQRSREKRR